MVQELPRTILRPYRYNYYLSSSSTTTNIGHYDHDDDNLPDRHAYANPFTIFSKRRRAGSCESLLPIGARWCAFTTLLFTVTVEKNAYTSVCDLFLAQRERERNRQKQRERERERERQRQRQRHRDTERHRETETQTDRQTYRDTDRDTETDKDTDTDRDREAETETETDTQADRQTDRHTEKRGRRLQQPLHWHHQPDSAIRWPA